MAVQPVSEPVAMRTARFERPIRTGVGRRAVAAMIVMALLSCTQEPTVDIDQVRIRTRELAEAAAAAVAPGIEAVTVSINDIVSCTGEGLKLQAIHDLELKWDREGFDRLALRERTERYFRQQGYDVEIQNPDSEVIDVIAYTNIFKIIVRVAILGHKDEVAVHGTGPCIEVDAETFDKKYLP